MVGLKKNILKNSQTKSNVELNENFSAEKNSERIDHPIFSKPIIDDKYSSKLRYDRPYLLSSETAHELNTYLSFSPFATFNDVYKFKYIETTKNNKAVVEESGSELLGTPGTRSLFNKAGAVIIGSSTGNFNIDITKGDANNTSEWRISNNVPLMDSPEARQRIRRNSGCSVKELVKASEDGLLGREIYSYSDFMYCKYLGRVSNNYMVTLRRFPLPVDDYISSLGEASRTNKNITSQNVTSIGCLVTWMGTPGNDMDSILAYSYHMPYKQQKAEWEQVDIDADSSSGIFNGIAAAFDPTYRKQYMSSQAGDTFNSVVDKFFKTNNALGKPHYMARDFLNFRDKNKTYGPIDAIKETYMRDDQEGLSFDQEITLTFDYELRSYNGINTRQAMLDLISNILNVTYTTGTFWGGGYRGGGAHQNNIFANLNIFKPAGGLTDYLQYFYKDVTGIFGKTQIGQNLVNIDWKDPSSWWDAVKQVGRAAGSFINQGFGMVIAGLLNNFGRPQKALVSSLLSPAPIGLWHVTVGNPHHPIMSVGNMILTNTKIEHYGPLGLDDFPTGLKVTCTLTRGKPRDIRDIEKLYMHGNDRIYSSMGPKIFDMYKHASEYKNQYTVNTNGSANVELNTNDTELNTIQNKKNENINNAIANSNISEIKNIKQSTFKNYNYKEMNNVLQKYFGHNDTYSIYVAAAEQEYGSDDKKPSKNVPGPSSGDSRDINNRGGETATIQNYGQ